MKIRLLIFFTFLLFHFFSFSQEKKSLNIKRINNAPKIDGVLDDTVWKGIDGATDFVQFRPEMGIKETSETKTVVKIVYDDNALYIGAYLYDDPLKIMRQFTSRDNFGQSDFFGVVLNPNNDAQNDTEFFVFSSGTQADAVSTPSNGEDFGWNAVWDSSVKITDDGWIIEMKIPYRALRFSNQNVQTWGIQFHRHFRRDRSQYTWSPIDITKGNIGLYHGELTGIKNIKPPVRLSLYPFASGLLTDFDRKTETDFNIGLDIKYGLTENFTLDATLIPDFSQAAFDNLTLNLGPFEQTFSEQRQFFTEGVDLFNKGNLFFSRRVGNAPTESATLTNNEELLNSPNEVKVLNAVKVSGRTKKGLGIGVFNAITEKTDAIIRDTITSEIRRQTIEPFTNYNIIVLDQQFNKNSSVSLVNTSVIREGSFRDANVTGLLFDITNKRNTYNLEGQVKRSEINDSNGVTTGFSSFFMARKTHGNYRYSFDHRYADTNYNINDLGLQFRNNFNNFGVDFSYRTFKPKGKLNRYRISSFINYRRLASPSTYTGTNFGVNFFMETKKLIAYGANFRFSPGKQFDYFEPRAEDRFFIYENRLTTRGFISTNFNKKFAFSANIRSTMYFEDDRDTYSIRFGVRPRVRFNDKFLIVYSLNVRNTKKDRGYVSTLGSEIIFGQRDRKAITNSISGNYSFNPLQTISLTFRNNWDTVEYEDELFALKENGRLTKDAGFTIANLSNNPDINFSTWNLDLSYSWQFAPGSFLTALYRNQLFNVNDKARDSYTESLSTLFEQPIQNTFSLRIQYFIDYADIKKVFRKRNNEKLEG